MEGAHDDGQGANCRKCGKPLGDNVIERKVGDEIFRFCSDECAESYMKEKEE